MKFWQSLAFCEPDQCAALARHAESLGFEGVTLAEHQFFPERLESRFPFSGDGEPLFDAEDEWPEMWPLIGAMATTTTRLRFCTAVHILPLLHPLTVARSAATADALAPGRVILGVGAGWMKEEYTVFGVDFESRGRRMEEAIEVLQAAWTGETFEFHGAFYDFPRLRVRPAPPLRIPIWMGGDSAPALRRAARVADGWIGGGGADAEIGAILSTLDSLRSQAGRVDEPFETMSLLDVGPADGGDRVQRLQAAGLRHIVRLPFSASLGKRSSLEQKCASLDRFEAEVMRHGAGS